MRGQDRMNERGYSIIELLVGSAVVLAVMATAMAFALSSRRIYEADHARTDLNQNLRAAMDFIAVDVRQAGERLGSDFPAIEIVDGEEGPDQLIVRRNLLDTVLRVCEELSDGDSTIVVGKTGGPSGCSEIIDDDDGWPENLGRWRDKRLAAGGEIAAYVYDPVDGSGEFFVYDGEDADDYTIGSASSDWNKTYEANGLVRIYILEERRYELQEGVLQFIENDDAVNPRKVVDEIAGLWLTAHFQDGNDETVLDATDDWRDLRSVEVRIEGSAPVRGRTIRRSWSSEIMPRNVMSR